MSKSVFTDKVVLLAGASQGVGAELARQLAEQGACLMLAARQEAKLAEVAAQCREAGAKVAFLATDLADEAQCKKLVEKTIETYGRLEVLLYVAAQSYTARFESLPDLDSARREINVNYLGLVYCSYYALPHLKKTKGRIGSVASLTALVGVPGTATYNASKHALRGFLNTLRAELLGSGVSVTVVYPSVVRTVRIVESLGDKLKGIPSMSVEHCTELTLDRLARRRRELVMTNSGKIAVWLYQLIPGVLDRQLARLSNLYD